MFDEPVKISLLQQGGEKATQTVALPLDVVLESLAKSVGLKPLVYHVYGTVNKSEKGEKGNHAPDWPLVRVDFEGKPFREVWNLLFATYGVKYQIDYLYLPPDIILVAPVNQLRTFKAIREQSGKTQLAHYKIEVPLNIYLTVKATENGQTVDIDLEKAKEWFKDEYLPHIIGEIGPATANWLVVQDSRTRTFQVPTNAGTSSVSINPAIVLFSLYATPAQHEKLKQYMKLSGIGFTTLTPPPPAKPVVRRFYQLKYLNPLEFKDFLRREVPGITVDIVPIPQQRILVVHGTEDQQDQVAELIHKFDVAPEVEQAKTEKAPIVRRFYAVRYLDPAKVTDFLMREVPGVKVSQVPGQKVLIVRGTEEQQKEVQTILAKIDVAPEAGPPIYQRTFKLSNAKAKDLAEVLSEALKAKGIAAAAGEGGEKAAPAGPNEVSVVADERTNTLIVTGTAEQLALVEELIPELDKPVDQVNVQVRIQEVTRNTLNSLGLNWEVAGGNLVTALADAGLQLIFDATRSLAALNIGATLNALEKQGLSHRVNDSNITVLNNQTGKIQSGFTFFIRRVVEGKVEKVPYDAGVIVEVTPQVTNSGEIVLKVHTEVSDILERNPVDGDVDKLSKQVSETILRVKDGQTVVIGGLIKNSTKYSKQGVPLLSDIPLIGALFSQTSDEREDNELIIVLKARRVTPTQCPPSLETPCP